MWWKSWKLEATEELIDHCQQCVMAEHKAIQLKFGRNYSYYIPRLEFGALGEEGQMLDGYDILDRVWDYLHYNDYNEGGKE